MRRTFLPLLAFGFGVALLLPGSSTAQNDTEQAAPPAAAPTAEKDYRGPLPDYFGKLGVGDKQRQELYAVDGEYAAKIAALHKQIEKLEAERDAKLEAMLTPGQKLRLKELREEAARRAAAEARQDAAVSTSQQN